MLTPLLLLKLTITPALIALNTWVGRRWGAQISGWLTGLPLTSGPVAVFLAVQHGPAFAAASAAGTVAGKLSVGIFALILFWMCGRVRWQVALACAFAGFAACTLIWNSFYFGLLPAVALAVLSNIALVWLMPKPAHSAPPTQPPAWDIPLRMMLATAFVLMITTLSANLGPQLSGLLSPFPIFVTLMSMFALWQHGPDAARQYLRAFVVGSQSFNAFFLVAGLALTRMNTALAFALAAVVCLLVNGVALWSMRRRSITQT